MLTEEKFIPFSASPLPPGPWLVFAPHPDDETFGMGGSLLLANRQDIVTRVVILTDGALGGKADNLTVKRREETLEATQLLGVKEVFFWNEPDRGLHATELLINRVTDLITRLKPASVFFPSPMEPHPDHRETARLVWMGLQRCEGFVGSVFSYDISIQGVINRLVDITEVVQGKAAAMSAYSTQLAENDYIEVVLALNRARSFSLPKGVDAAEGFYAYNMRVGQSLAAQTALLLKPYWQENSAYDQVTLAQHLETIDSQQDTIKTQQNELRSHQKSANRQISQLEDALKQRDCDISINDKQLKLLTQENAKLHELLNLLEGSISWRLTKPLRTFKKLLKSLRNSP